MRGGCLLEVVAHGGSTVLHLIIANCASLVMSPFSAVNYLWKALRGGND